MLVARLVVRTFRWLKNTKPHGRFFYKCRVWMTMGQIWEIWSK